MFAPKIAKAPTKASDSPTRKQAPQPSTLVARPLGGGAVEQARMLQRTIGNQATLRLLAQRTSNLTKNRRGGGPEQEADPANLISRGATPGVSWDFSKIPVFSPDRATRPQASFALAAKPLPGAIRAKLVVGQVNDPLEHEADRIADQVMRMPAPGVSVEAVPPQISRKSAACEKEDKLQKMPARPQAASEAPGIVHDVLRSSGQPLDAATRAYFEPRFGRNFSAVRVHADATAAQSARDVNARAYTVGHNIVFGAGGFTPSTHEGQRLIAHELTHVVQQSNGALYKLKRQPSSEPSQGAKVTVDNLRPLLERRIDRWKDAAYIGVQNFTDNELGALLKGGGLDTFGFVSNLIGNIAWAATCFTPGANAFAISLAGIGLGAYGTYAGAPRGDPARPLLAVKERFQGYIDTIHVGLSLGIKPSSEAVVKEYPNDWVISALDRIMSASLEPEFLTAIENPPWKTEIAERAVTTAYEKYATDFLKHYQLEISPTMPGPHSLSLEGEHSRADEPSIIQIKGRPQLALAQLWLNHWSFMRWISPQLHDTALRVASDQWKAAGVWFDPSIGDVKWSEEQPLPSLDAGDVNKVPNPGLTVTPLPIVTPIGPEEEAETRGKWIAEKLRRDGLTQDVHREIAQCLKQFQGNARQIFIEQISNHPEIDMTP